MPTQVQFRRGTTTQNNAFTGAVGEISVDTTLDHIRLHDGSTAGGHRLALYSELNTGDITAVVAGTGLTGGATSGSATVSLSHLGIESLSDPNADRIVFWDDSAGASQWLTAGTGLSISGTTIAVGTLNQDTTGTADNVTVSANNSTDETVYPLFADGATGSQGVESDTGLTYNPSSGLLTTTSVAAALTGNVTGNVSGSSGSTTGNAATATALATGRTIHGVSFDGTANIDLTEVVQDTVGAMVSSNTESGITVAYEDGDGTLDFTVGTLNQNTTGTAASWTTARTLSFTGDVTGTGSVDGSANVATALTIAANSVALGTDTTGNYMTDASAGTGVTITHTPAEGSTATIAIGQAVATDSDVTFADLTLSGDLTVNGTTSTLASTNSLISDALIELANGTSGTPGNDAGLVIERGSADNAFIGYDESADKFTVGTGSFTGASTGNLTITTGTLVANLEGNVTGNVTGNADTATTATTATNVTASANNSTDETVYPTFIDGATGGQGIETDTGLTYNPSSGLLTSTLFAGALTGNVTGNVSGSSGSTTGNAATATALETARTIGGTSFDGTANIAVGLAATATALATARTIHGVSFDGTANIDLSEVVADTVGAMFSSNTETGITATYQDADNTVDLVVGTLNQDTTGNAATATALETARTLSFTGDVTGTGSFDGTGNLATALTIAANSVALGTDTTGNYMAQVSGGNGITISHSQGEGSTATITGTAIYNAAGSLLN
jgi:hypothetical protein